MHYTLPTKVIISKVQVNTATVICDTFMANTLCDLVIFTFDLLNVVQVTPSTPQPSFKHLYLQND